MAPTRFSLSSLPLAGGLLSSVLAAIGFTAMPEELLALVIQESGLPLFIPSAQTPLSATGRAMLATMSGLGTGAVVWATLYLLFGRGGWFAREGGYDGLPEVRSADAHPDAPPRRPFFVADFGPPPPPVSGAAAPKVSYETDLPRDLDLSLAAFDPTAIPDQPCEPVRMTSPLTRAPAPLSPGERIETFEISTRQVAESGVPSIESLLARLERGAYCRQQQLGQAS